MAYSRGVLIHNFNEDQFGRDLQSIPPPPDQSKVSMTHLVHHWKFPDPAPKVDPAAAGHVERHLFFGHAGDMRDPRTTLQQTNFTTAHRYFMQDPKDIPGVGHLSADNFTISEDPRKLGYTSHLATTKKEGWGDGRQCHSLPPPERFLTTHKVSYTGEREQDPAFRMPRHYGEFTTLGDRVNLTRSTATFRSTGKLALSR
mmetsp:Transcript_57570/g.122442  ORF Transcript_57570/g.122442 Transcript_57570/m.122442 type:complete len:200 (-) Transcript_57570:194-793(-)